MSLRLSILVCLAAISFSATVYDPPEAGKALDAVENALNAIVKNPHLPAGEMAAAKKVVADVEGTVVFLESAQGKALTKQARGVKVMAAIKELQELQATWQKSAMSMADDKKAELLKKLKAKEAELAKDQKMMKVLNLEKALDEKKLALQKLIDAKNNKAAQQQNEKEIAAREEMVANVLKMAKDLQSSKGTKATMTHAVKNVAGDNSKLLSTVSAYLEGRMKTLKSSMEDLDSAQKKREAMIKATLGEAKVATKGDMAKAGMDAELKKSQAMLDMLMKKEQRSYKKARVPLQSEFNEVAEAVKSIKQGDVGGLAKVMTHMEGEMKSLQAKSHKFLY